METILAGWRRDSIIPITRDLTYIYPRKVLGQYDRGVKTNLARWESPGPKAPPPLFSRPGLARPPPVSRGRVSSADRGRAALAARATSGDSWSPSACSGSPSPPLVCRQDLGATMGARIARPLVPCHRVVVLGLDSSGKTTILYRLKQQRFTQNRATICFNSEKVFIENRQRYYLLFLFNLLL